VPQPAPPQPDISIFSPLGRGGTSEHGGITPVVLNLAAAFSEAGRRVELLTFSPEDPRILFPSLTESLQIRNLGRGSRLRHLFQLAGYLQERRPAVLLAAGLRPNLIAAACKRLLRPPGRLFLSLHNSLSPGLGELGTIQRRLRIRGMRATYPYADGLVCVSTGVAEDLRRYLDPPCGKLHVIYNPVLSPQQIGRAPAVPPHPWLEPGQPPLILGAGRLTRQKDFSTLIRAYALVAAQRDCRLMILGEGQERSALEGLAARLGLDDRVALPGFVSAAMAYMAHAGLFALSSAWEGFGMVLVEAMAMGTPVVSTDCPSGPREILRDGELGPLVPVSDPEALASAMLQVLDSPPDRERLRRRAVDFTSDRAAERYLRLMFPSEEADHARG
jgi:glycosyltransferase involved in cell wall biosynthesis